MSTETKNALQSLCTSLSSLMVKIDLKKGDQCPAAKVCHDCLSLHNALDQEPIDPEYCPVPEL